MPEITVNAVVLKRRDAGESDRRLTLLTLELGKIDVLAKGARKPTSRLAGCSEPLSVAVFGLAEGRQRFFVTQAQPVSSFRGLRTDYDRLTHALALTELYAAVLPFEQPLPEAYELLIRSFQSLEVHSKVIVASVWAQMELLALSGFGPQLECCVMTDQPFEVAEPWVSPEAGGVVNELDALRFSDRFRVRAEVLFGLARISDLVEPPANLKFAAEALETLHMFWRRAAEAPIPANESLVGEVRHSRLNIA